MCKFCPINYLMGEQSYGYGEIPRVRMRSGVGEIGDSALAFESARRGSRGGFANSGNTTRRASGVVHQSAKIGMTKACLPVMIEPVKRIFNRRVLQEQFSNGRVDGNRPTPRQQAVQHLTRRAKAGC
ncbi:hypothetical protein KHDHEBDM_00887 [Pectobacterium polaris]|nr:hypothetical protein KHDHEBDM_00887 [Pectobacterium polaris]